MKRNSERIGSATDPGARRRGIEIALSPEGRWIGRTNGSSEVLERGRRERRDRKSRDNASPRRQLGLERGL